MINTKEIRTGNWVMKGAGSGATPDAGYVYKLIAEDEYSFTFASQYFPIPLSADLLGRSSFRHAFGNWYKNLASDGIEEGLPFLRYHQKTKQGSRCFRWRNFRFRPITFHVKQRQNNSNSC